MFILLWLASVVASQSSAEESASQSVITLTESASLSAGDRPSAITLPSDFDGSTIQTSSSIVASATASRSTSNSTTSSVSFQATYTQLVGGSRTANNRTATATSVLPVNTQPCNNYPELCNRKYSNITEVCAHNSPFVRARNAASNQELTVTQQLDDGIRMLQGQVHNINGTLYYCHTSCDLLNAGTVEEYLRDVTQWVAAHPFDVITILFGNYGFQDKDADGNSITTAKNFAEPIEASGLLRYVYQPPNTAMTLDDWPTLGELILSGKRVITFIDYGPDTDAVPYLLWEFYNIWETPFSPTKADFTCDVQRPEGVSENRTREMMYIANHNLNVEVSISGLNLLIPNFAELGETNGVNGSGSLGEMTNLCTGELLFPNPAGRILMCVEKWNRPPNFLLVDFYNYGSPVNGSVFEVAARANGVTYDRKCCGEKAGSACGLEGPSAAFAFVIAIAVALLAEVN